MVVIASTMLTVYEKLPAQLKERSNAKKAIALLIAAYGVKKLYPLIWGKLGKRTSKKLGAPLPHSTEVVDVSAKKKSSSPAVNREFFQRLGHLLRILFPKLFCKELGLLGFHSLALIARTFLSIYVASLDGMIVKTIVKKDPQVGLSYFNINGFSGKSYFLKCVVEVMFG